MRLLQHHTFSPLPPSSVSARNASFLGVASKATADACDATCSIIVGSVVGGVSFIALVVIALLCYCYCCKERRIHDRARQLIRPFRPAEQSSTAESQGVGNDAAARTPVAPTPPPVVVESILKHRDASPSVPSSTPPLGRVEYGVGVGVDGETSEADHKSGASRPVNAAVPVQKCLSTSTNDVTVDSPSGAFCAYSQEASVTDARRLLTPCGGVSGESASVFSAATRSSRVVLRYSRRCEKDEGKEDESDNITDKEESCSQNPFSPHNK